MAGLVPAINNPDGEFNAAMSFDAAGLFFKIVLGPILILQGGYVRRSALILPEAAGPRTGFAGAGKRLDLLVMGDSAAAGVGVETQNEALCGQIVEALSDAFEVHWRIMANTGATTASTRAAVDALAEQRFDAVVVSLGVNDVTRGVDLATWIDQQTKLYAVVRARLRPKTIFVAGMPPVSGFPLLPQPLRWFLGRQAKRFDRALRQWVATEDDCVFVPLNFTMNQKLMARDGFHPGQEIYRIWAHSIASQLRASADRAVSLAPSDTAPPTTVTRE
jgi:lysophospholipase L1-like esterase